MTKRKVELRQFVHCPFCDYLCETSNPGQWCASCYVEWYISRDGEFIIFDDMRKTPRFAWAKAFGKAGGVSFGTVTPVKGARDE